MLLPLLVAPLIALSVVAWRLAGQAESQLLAVQREQHAAVLASFDEALAEKLRRLARPMRDWAAGLADDKGALPPDRGQLWTLIFDDTGQWWYPPPYALAGPPAGAAPVRPGDGAADALAEAARHEQSAASLDLAAETYENLLKRDSLAPAARAEALLGLARCMRRLAKPERARECYDLLTNDFAAVHDETGASFAAWAAEARVDLAQSTRDPEQVVAAWRRYADDLIAERYVMDGVLAVGHVTTALATSPTDADDSEDDERRTRLETLIQKLEGMSDAVTQSLNRPDDESPRLTLQAGHVLLRQSFIAPPAKRWVVTAFRLGWIEEELLAPIVDDVARGSAGVLCVEDALGQTVAGQSVDPQAVTAAASLARFGLPWTARVAFDDLNALRDQARRRHALLTGSIVVLIGLIVAGVAIGWRMVHREMELSKLKSDFVDNVSHELRTPVTSIKTLQRDAPERPGPGPHARA